MVCLCIVCERSGYGLFESGEQMVFGEWWSNGLFMSGKEMVCL